MPTSLPLGAYSSKLPAVSIGFLLNTQKLGAETRLYSALEVTYSAVKSMGTCAGITSALRKTSAENVETCGICVL